MSPNNWLNFLNLDFEAQSAAAMAPVNSNITRNSSNNNNNDAMLSSGFDFSGLGNSPLSDDLKAQLEAWTNVSFGGDENHHSSSSSSSSGQGGRDSSLDNNSTNYFNVVGSEDTKKDPSPYAKRPFGNFSSNYQALERGFEAFAGASGVKENTQSTASTPAQQQILSQAPNAHLTTNTPVSSATTPGSNNNSNNNESWQSSLPVFDFTKSFGPLDTAAYPMLPEFAQNLAQQQAQTIQLHKQQQQQAALASQASTPSSVADNTVPPPPAKRQRTNASSSSASPATKARETSEGDASSNTESYVDANGVLVKRQPLLTKAAILAQQLEELKNKQGRTPEEEAIRQAELNRIAAEDDKRRRNTAASARFRVKKKQREAALEDTINELKAKVSTIEQELAKTKNENTFLRDLVIRKVCLSLTLLPLNLLAVSNFLVCPLFRLA